MFVSPKRRLTFNRLHGVMSQNVELFRAFCALQLYLMLLETPKYTGLKKPVETEGF
jgi:hypothetical protein